MDEKEVTFEETLLAAPWAHLLLKPALAASLFEHFRDSVENDGTGSWKPQRCQGEAEVRICTTRAKNIFDVDIVLKGFWRDNDILDVFQSMGADDMHLGCVKSILKWIGYDLIAVRSTSVKLSSWYPKVAIALTFESTFWEYRFVGRFNFGDDGIVKYSLEAVNYYDAYDCSVLAGLSGFHAVSSQLNGSHGEYTCEDDHMAVNRGRTLGMDKALEQLANVDSNSSSEPNRTRKQARLHRLFSKNPTIGKHGSHKREPLVIGPAEYAKLTRCNLPINRPLATPLQCVNDPVLKQQLDVLKQLKNPCVKMFEPATDAPEEEAVDYVFHDQTRRVGLKRNRGYVDLDDVQLDEWVRKNNIWPRWRRFMRVMRVAGSLLKLYNRSSARLSRVTCRVVTLNRQRGVVYLTVAQVEELEQRLRSKSNKLRFLAIAWLIGKFMRALQCIRRRDSKVAKLQSKMRSRRKCFGLYSNLSKYSARRAGLGYKQSLDERNAFFLGRLVYGKVIARWAKKRLRDRYMFVHLHHKQEAMSYMVIILFVTVLVCLLSLPLTGMPSKFISLLTSLFVVGVCFYFLWVTRNTYPYEIKLLRMSTHNPWTFLVDNSFVLWNKKISAFNGSGYTGVYGVFVKTYHVNYLITHYGGASATKKTPNTMMQALHIHLESQLESQSFKKRAVEREYIRLASMFVNQVLELSEAHIERHTSNKTVKSMMDLDFGRGGGATK